MKGILIQEGTPTPDKPVEIKTITIPLNKVSYEDLEALTIEQQTQLFAKDKEIERLNSIIKEVREYIKNNEKEYGSLEDNEKIILEILDKEENE